MVGVRGTPTQIFGLFGLPGLRSIYYNAQLEYFLNQSVPLIGADRVWNELGYTGRGVTVAVIDRGTQMHCSVSSGGRVAVALALVAWLVWPGAAVAQSVSGAATAVWATAAGTTTALAATGSLANSDDARVASELTGPILGLGSAEALHAAAISSIDAWDALDEVASQAALGNLALTVAGNQISADFAMAWATAPVGAASTGGSTVEGLLVNGIPILPTGAPNERFDLPGATLILNEVQTTTAGTTVNALHIATWDGLVKVVIASATAGVTSTSSTTSTTDSTTSTVDSTLSTTTSTVDSTTQSTLSTSTTGLGL